MTEPREARAEAALTSLSRGGAMILGLGLVLAAVGLVTAPAAVPAASLIGFLAPWGLAMGALFFVALHHATGAVWSVIFRRAAEAVASTLPWTIALFAIVAAGFWCPAMEPLFPWAAHHGVHDASGRELFLNVPFFLARASLYFAIWLACLGFFVRGSLAQSAETTIRMRRAAGPFLLVFAVTLTFASIDWIMSLTPHWFSTIFGIYVFAGIVPGALAVIVLTVLWLDANGLLPGVRVTGDHLYSLGALQFAFVSFWAYIAFSQYMLIWYGNFPEETIYFQTRLGGRWFFVTVLLVMVRFVLPFLLLLPRWAKKSPLMLAPVSLLLLFGYLLDLAWMAWPVGLGWQGLTPLIGMILAGLGLMILAVARFIRAHGALPLGDPLLAASKEFHL